MPIYNAPLKKIDAKETRRYAGLAIADFNEQSIIDACNELIYTAEPRSCWEIYDYNNITHTVAASSPFIIEGSKIQQHLSHCQKAVIIAATIGSNIEKIIEKSFQTGDYSHALLLDAAATTAVEQTADSLEKNIEPMIAALGYKRIWRFSPGYGDWAIDCQPEMIRLSKASAIGINTTSSMMLTPRKSITAVIGLIPQTDPFLAKRPSCANCSQRDCPSRIAIINNKPQ